MKKEFKVSNEDLVIYVKVVRDELHDVNRYLMIIHRFDPGFEDVYRLVEPFGLMDIIESYLK